MVVGAGFGVLVVTELCLDGLVPGTVVVLSRVLVLAGATVAELLCAVVIDRMLVVAPLGVVVLFANVFVGVGPAVDVGIGPSGLGSGQSSSPDRGIRKKRMEPVRQDQEFRAPTSVSGTHSKGTNKRIMPLLATICGRLSWLVRKTSISYAVRRVTPWHARRG